MTDNKIITFFFSINFWYASEATSVPDAIFWSDRLYSSILLVDGGVEEVKTIVADFDGFFASSACALAPSPPELE